MKGVKCWAAVFGGKEIGSLHLHMGRKLPREHPLRNPHLPAEAKTHAGEHSLLIWSSWRLQRDGKIIASSDSDRDTLQEASRALVGRRVTGAWVYKDTWDLWVYFDDGLRLTVFCDLLSDEPGGLENWHYRFRNTTVVADAQGGLDLQTNT
jgi:hypothetical protein